MFLNSDHTHITEREIIKMKSFLLVVIAAFGLAIITTGCGGSPTSAPTVAPADNDGGATPKQAEPDKKKGRLPKGPAQ